MGGLAKQFLLALVLFTALAKLSEARAKAEADFWSEEDDDDDDFWGKSDDEDKDEPAPAAARSNANAGQAVAAAPSDPHANHPASHHVHNSPTDARQNWDTVDGFQGGNFASHNESCTPSKHCMKNVNMECSSTDGTGRCKCITGWVYVRSTESCWKIPLSSQEECGHDVQCQAGSWGHLSRCNKQTARCACHDWSGANRDTIRTEDGICYIKKKVGDLCKTHEECDNPIPGDAFCQYGQYDSAGGQNYNGSCQCKDTHTWYNPSGKCLPKATKLGDPCEVSDQCRDGSLGKLSTCDRDSASCRCLVLGGALNNTEIIYYERLKKCFVKREYNDTCTEDDECRANLGPDVECGRTDDYPDTDVCHCPKGKVCRSSGFSMVTVGGNAFSTASLACASIVIGMTIKMKGFLTTTSG